MTALHSAAASEPLYELRVYYAHAGKLDELHVRFRNHTTKLFEKHSMTNTGYWVPLENSENKLIYILSYPNRQAREKSWKAFQNDPEWKRVYAESHKEGPLVAKVESVFLIPTDYSPEVIALKAKEPRTFELRTYKASPGKLDRLHRRFRDHTIKLFSKHGMTHIGYWVPAEKKDGAEDTLIYILAHDSPEAARKSFANFRADPEWIASKEASEEDGSLTLKVDSVLMKSTNYSPVQ